MSIGVGAGSDLIAGSVRGVNCPRAAHGLSHFGQPFILSHAKIDRKCIGIHILMSASIDWISHTRSDQSATIARCVAAKRPIVKPMRIMARGLV